MTNNPNWQSNMEFEPTKAAIAQADELRPGDYTWRNLCARLIDHLNGTVPEDADMSTAREWAASQERDPGTAEMLAAGLMDDSAKIRSYLAGIKHGRAMK